MRRLLGGRSLPALILVLGAVAVQLLAAGPAAACGLPRPHGPVILTVSGEIGACNEHHAVKLDLAMLEALPAAEIRSVNPWDAHAVTYQGVLLRDLMRYVKASGKTASIEALNDYHADITLKEMRTHDVILAYRRDGDLIEVRHKGPLFVVFPHLDRRERVDDRRYSQSVWQVRHIEVR